MKTAVLNGKIYLGDNEFAQALLIENKIVIKTGTNEEIIKSLDESTTKIDLEGKSAVAGFHDSHMHLLNLGNVLNAVPLNGAKSHDDIVDLTKKYIAEKNPPKGSFIQGRGWNQDYFEGDKSLPTCRDLDKISSEYPVIFVRACGHMMVCNSKLLELAGVTKDTKQPEGGEFYTFEDGTPNGLFSERACNLITSQIPSLTSEQIAANLKVAMNYINSYGITAIQTNDIYADNVDKVIAGYDMLHKSGNATAHIYHQCGLGTPELIKDFVSKYGKTGSENSFGTVGPLKMLIDGSLGARTALMRKPYSDNPSTQGICCIPEEHIEKMVKTADSVGMQAAIHAIGDLAIEKVLDIYERVGISKENPLRHGIVHCQITDMPLVERFKEGNILAYVQPIFVHYDQHIVESRVGKDLAESSYAFATMDKMGIHTSYGTDAPVEDPNTAHNLYTAVTRLDLRGNGPYIEGEAVSVKDAVRLYTEASAYFCFKEDEIGKLKVGYQGDIAVLDKDIFEIDPVKIKDVKVDMTILGGEIVYKR